VCKDPGSQVHNNEWLGAAVGWAGTDVDQWHVDVVWTSATHGRRNSHTAWENDTGNFPSYNNDWNVHGLWSAAVLVLKCKPNCNGSNFIVSTTFNLLQLASCLADKREDYQNCSVLYCVPYHINTHKWTVLTSVLRFVRFKFIKGFLLVLFIFYLCAS